jgi:pimeloyl-ACP methyl ester carboxylesterase
LRRETDQKKEKAGGLSMPKIFTRATEIYYHEIGQGPALLLVPGLGAHSKIWGPFPKRFAEGRRVIVFDPRGLGKSSAGEEPLTLDLMASDVIAVLDAAAADTAALLGASLGALVALKVALEYPERVSRLILVTPAFFRSRHGDWMLQTLRLLAERLSPQEFIQALMPLAFAPPFFEKGFGMIKEVSRMLTPTPAEMEQIKRQLDALQDEEMPEDLSMLKIPTLLIAGSRDILAPVEGARHLAAKIRGSRLITLPDAGHSPFVEATEDVVKEIRSFLTE